MRGLYDEELDLTEEIKGSLDRCLGCRACETACPSGVPYGELLEKARGVIHETSSQSLIKQTLRTVLLKGLFYSTFLLSTASKLLKLYALTGRPKLITNTALGKILPHLRVPATSATRPLHAPANNSTPTTIYKP